jgi:outer membrane receptor protein involved in Fe transport
MYTNLGKLDYYGIDALGRVRVQRMVEVGGAYDYIIVYQEAEDGNPEVENPLPRLPHNRWEAWAQVTPRPGLSLLGRVTYYGEFLDMGGPSGEVTLTGYTLVSVTGTWYLSREYLIVARIDDLLNERPETRYGYYGDGRTLSVIFQGTW